MTFNLNASSMGLPILDTVPAPKKVGRVVSDAEARVQIRSNQVQPWLSEQMAAYADVSLTPVQKRKLGARAVLTHA